MTAERAAGKVVAGSEPIWDGKEPRHGVEVRFIRGRLHYQDAKNSTPFPSVIVVFRPPHAALRLALHTEAGPLPAGVVARYELGTP